MSDTAQVDGPWCCESISICIDPGTRGSFVEDCEVSCRPWEVRAERDELTSELVVAMVSGQ